MVSIKDIAKACGVSVATVSKALNGHNDISQATKEKVREAARQMGYMPNSAAQHRPRPFQLSRALPLPRCRRCDRRLRPVR